MQNDNNLSPNRWHTGTLLPLQGENDLTRLTRDDADALPRAKCFWAFSPKNIALLSKCAKLCLDLRSGIKRELFWSNRTTPHAPQGQPAISPTQSEATRRGKRQQNIFALQGQKRNFTINYTYSLPSIRKCQCTDVSKSLGNCTIKAKFYIFASR